MPKITIKNPLFFLVYLTSFLYSFHYSLPLYIESSFISQFLPTEEMVGLMFAIAAVFTSIFTFLLPRILQRWGNYRATLTTMGLEVITLIALATLTSPILIIPLFIFHQTLASVIFLNLDHFVESFSNDSETGGIRGTFMTVLNVATAIAPFIAGLMLTDHDFWKVYLAGAMFMALAFFVIAKNFKNYKGPHYTHVPFKKTLLTVIKSHDLHSIIFMHFLLSFFYAWMVIYTPLYMNKHMGIPMNQILGIITPIALLPFIFFEVILGKIADTKLGEKEILTAGFMIMAISTATLSFVVSNSVLLWALLLFLTRTGASAVEVMTESYFYKQIGPEDTHLITFMRMIRSTAYIIGPLAGSILLSFVDYRFLFLVLGIIMLTAIPYSLTIKDTR